MPYTTPKTWTAEVLTSADMNTFIRDNQAYLKANIGLGAVAELTIATGSVTKTKGYHSIDTEGDAASDELDNIQGGSEGDVLFIRAANAARTVILKDGTAGGDNLDLHGHDIYLTDTDQLVSLIYDGTNWLLVAAENRVVEFTANAFQYPNPGTDWTPEKVGAGLAANLTAKICWLPLDFLKIGDQIISYKLVGDMHEEGGDTCTLDGKMYSANKTDPLTSTDIAGGGIAQVTADGNFDVLATLTAAEIVVTDKQYGIEITGTTSNVSSNEAIKVMGAEVKVIRLS